MTKHGREQTYRRHARTGSVGKRFPELPYPPELGARLQSELDEVVATGHQVKGETYYKSPTGKEGWYEYIFNPILDATGNVASVAGSTRNVTVRQEQERRLTALHESERLAREEAERAGKLKDEFLATLSHELRTPLQAIQGWADLLRSGRLPAEQMQRVGDRIARNARTQGQLIADLLDMNRIVSGKGTARYRTGAHQQADRRGDRSGEDGRRQQGCRHRCRSLGVVVGA